MALSQWEKSVMANLHVLLDHTWNSKISKISIRCQIWGSIQQLISWTQKCIQKTFQTWEGPFNNFSSWTQKWKIYIDILYGDSYNIKHITTISNLHFQ